MKHNIWTWYYNPWKMGGSCNQPMLAEVECLGPYDLGKGYEGYYTVSPNGRTFVMEAETGAIVGYTLEEVRSDISSGDEQEMRDQIGLAKVAVIHAEHVTIDEFWKRMRCK
jgi:hypothetical protein